MQARAYVEIAIIVGTLVAAQSPACAGGLLSQILDRQPQSTEIPDATFLPAGVPTKDPPPGFVSFCIRYEDQCDAPSDQPATIKLDAAIWQNLQETNARVNVQIQPADDKSHFDRSEYWMIPQDGLGNCKDYALTKREILASDGLPLRALRMAIVVAPDDVRHAVLTVATDRGDFVLDNLTDDVLPWEKTGYHWLERQNAKGDWGWVAFSDTAEKDSGDADAHAPSQ